MLEHVDLTTAPAHRKAKFLGHTYGKKGWSYDGMNADYRARKELGQTFEEMWEAIIDIPYLTYHEVPYELRVPL